MPPAEEGWRNRITSTGTVQASTLMANRGNARKHPASQRAALKGVLNQVGWVARVIVNERSGLIVDGHLRVEEAAARNEDVPVDYVDLSPAEEALILALFDPIGALAETDRDNFEALLAQIETVEQGILDMVDTITADNLAADENTPGGPENYSRKIKSPVYEIRGENPPVKELRDRTKADALRASITAADLPEDVARFLLDAAERHVVFQFDRIAEFYAHASPDVQALMEDSVLVIIDFNKAIEDGFVKLSDDIAAQYAVDLQGTPAHG